MKADSTILALRGLDFFLSRMLGYVWSVSRSIVKCCGQSKV